MPFPDGGLGDDTEEDDAQDPRLAKVRDLAQNPSPQSVDELMELAKGNDLAAVEACGVILDWGHGPVEDAVIVDEPTIKEATLRRNSLGQQS